MHAVFYMCTYAQIIYANINVQCIYIYMCVWLLVYPMYDQLLDPNILFQTVLIKVQPRCPPAVCGCTTATARGGDSTCTEPGGAPGEIARLSSRGDCTGTGPGGAPGETAMCWLCRGASLGLSICTGCFGCGVDGAGAAFPCNIVGKGGCFAGGTDACSVATCCCKAGSPATGG